MPHSFDIVGFGICAVDYVGLAPKYPEAGEKVPLEAYCKQGGGNTGTALVTAARLGAKTAYLGKLGRDEYSLFLLNEFEKEGVNFGNIVFADRAQPPVAFIHVDKNTGEKRIARYWQNFDLKPKELNRNAIRNSKLLFLDHYFTEAGKYAAECIKSTGGTVVVDAERPTPGFARVLQRADYIVTSSRFAREWTGNIDPEKASEKLYEEFSSTIVVTAGTKGAYCQAPDGQFHQPAFDVKVVDTTGAGDVFHGAFTIGLLKNWPLRKIVEFAAVVAALKCRGLGGRAMIPSLQEALAYLIVKGTREFWNE